IVDTNYDHGYKETNGKWTGMMKTLVKNESDVAIGDFSAIEERFAVTKFSPPLTVRHEFSILSKKFTNKDKNSPFYFLSSFTIDAWIAVIFMFLFIIAVQFIVNRVRNETNSSANIRNIIWYYFHCLLIKSCPNSNRFNSVINRW